MPLVRIALLQGKSPEYRKQIGDVVHRAMVEKINCPPQDRFQLITEHARDNFLYAPVYLGIPHSDNLVIIQITLNEGRTTELKKALYQAIVEGLQKEIGLDKQDVFIGLIEVKKENWSFGNGLAQYAG
ncbi:MAG: tautomerase family protein [Sulfuricaulis sp.]|uniref:tautomerase family protein n=1 Tax=Sulfuricaulis sp. TaxID=2003553 RepID=UPI0034A2A5E9